MQKYEGVSTTGKPADMKVEQHEDSDSVLFRVTEYYQNGRSGQHPVILSKAKVKQLISDLVMIL